MGYITYTDEISLIPSYKVATPPTKFPLDLAPSSLRPYLELIRLEKRVSIVYSNGLDSYIAWGLTMAAFSIQLPVKTYAIELLKFLIGAFILRSSACTVNDIFDRRVDAGVERTRNRPIPSGRISVFAAIIFLFAQYAVGIAFFYFTVKDTAFAIYPILKRYTHWPQAWLGFAMNFGFITAWVATTKVIDIPLLLTSIMACWCFTKYALDTVYACQDIEDDLKTGVRSTAILFGNWIRPLLRSQGGSISRGVPILFFQWEEPVCLDVPKSCWSTYLIGIMHRKADHKFKPVNFNRNGQLGWIIWSGLIVDYLQLMTSLQIM
ncbi:hypothetical protein CVT25_002331 [Psilocybe cyanescens]|uniref:Uncharacterized protein n=1 Tax=Psilocybe cyanescens TaxID=93625 RepID=A0A409WKK4_PSICY|nr:hypothetical protein CVT25_002331 [Psilocybe cyanescens]